MTARHFSAPLLALALMALLVLPRAAGATDLQVPTECATIQEAVSLAADGDTITLLPGFYSGPGNCDICFEGKAITIRSSTGSPMDCVIDCETTPGRYARGFVFKDGETRSSVLEGITIRNGHKLDNPGGGIRISGASPTIRNCRFIDNWSDPRDTSCQVYVNSGEPLLQDCTFIGGSFGILADHHAAQPVLVGCVFWEAWASVAGWGNASIDMTDCWLNDSGSTGLFGDSIHVRMKHCFVEGNRFAGIWLYGASTLECDQSVIGWNYPFGGGSHGGLHLFGNSTAKIRRSYFTMNSNVGLRVAGNSSARVENCWIEHSKTGIAAEYGAALEVVNTTVFSTLTGINGQFSGPVTVTNCTFVGF